MLACSYTYTIKNTWIFFFLLTAFTLSVWPQAKEDKSIEESRQAVKTLTPLGEHMPEQKTGDWLDLYYEAGQTFEQYIKAVKIPLDPQRKTIYIRPVGNFTPTQRKIEQAVAEFLGVFYNLPVKPQSAISLENIPGMARRKNPLAGNDQILTRYILEEKIFPTLPKDTAAYLAFSTCDLWTGDDNNFVFGEASSDDPVGIWSMARYGDPDSSKEAFQRCLLRALKVATHETGHMFGLMHCTMHLCCMNGYNNLAEEDSHPLAFCPECIAKVCLITKTDIKDHCRRVAKFLRDHGFDDEALRYEAYLKVLDGFSTHNR